MRAARAEVLLDASLSRPAGITQDVRDYAEAHGVDVEAAIPEGMKAKAEAFRAGGGELYQTAPSPSDRFSGD
jgi:hypothetical protein